MVDAKDANGPGCKGLEARRLLLGAVKPAQQGQQDLEDARLRTCGANVFCKLRYALLAYERPA